MFDFISFSTPALLAYGIAAGGAIVFGLLAYILYRKIMSERKTAALDEQLRFLLEDDDEVSEPLDRGRNLVERWLLYWRRIGQASGIQKYSARENDLPRDVFFAGLVVAIAVSFIFKNVFAGPAGAIILFYLVGVYGKNRYNSSQEKLQDQIPSFLFALKANIQANETPVRAILKIVDNMPEPLRSELLIVKQKILSNASFAESLESLKEKTQSRDLRFLATCLIQAAGTGANIEPQINTIQDVLSQRKKASDELKKAVKATAPASIIASLSIPVVFVATYIMGGGDEFWFKSLVSWIALAAIVALWGFGLWMSRRLVEGIRNL